MTVPDAPAPHPCHPPSLRLALYEPEIAGNVGTVLRLAACLDVPVDLIEPMGFPFSDRALARSGMDYLRHVTMARHADWASFKAQVPGRIVLLTTKAATRLDQAQFLHGDTLLCGSESSGVPEHVHAAVDLRITIPLVPGRRSLNVALAAAIALSEALRQTDQWPA
ncbi:tRNA (cytidine(34)-2'-O)-methyltransferase [Sphingomonas sp. 28-62-11]|uniref:tRNA (cytidine(34)-2'-O)-methyltransferase n=1 Tax=Sphingomonas sp. 28-62-11 TaxID=1970432 RepID=UPI000BDCEF35|nr:MAG: rRNA methyltransferase [Sphingomonas sp. 28-62-11]